MSISGYRTNADHTQTLAWTEGVDGSVTCDHDAKRCCASCVENDSRLGRRAGRVVVANWPASAIREGRTVHFVDLSV